MSIEIVTRRRIFAFLTAVLTLLACGSLLMRHAGAEGADNEAALKKRFEFLSQNTNVDCSAKFEASIAYMAQDARLQGSCCAPMDETRYRQQLNGLRNYSEIAEVPPNPYDISARLADKLMGYSARKSRLITIMRWSTRICRDPAAASAGAGRCMAVWASS
jgi:hypothetical protein